MKTQVFMLWFCLAGILAGQKAVDPPIFDERIKVFSFAPIEYPLKARLKHTQGVVVVRVQLDKNGMVSKAVALSGPEDLVSAAAENAKRWRFQPTSGTTAILLYHFSIQGLCQSPCPSQFLFSPPNLATIVIGEAVVSHAREP